MSNPVYIINDWDDNFEVSESRKIKKLSWVALPNRHDSAPFRRVAQLQNSPEIFAAWVLIVQIASKMPVRGVLQNSAGPLTCEDLALMTGFPEKIFAAAFLELQKPGIKWISILHPGSQEILPARPDMSGSVGATLHYITGQDPTHKSAKDEFWKPLCSIFGIEPKTISDEQKLYDQCRDFRLKGATVEEIKIRAENYRDRFPDVAFTPKAVLGNWDLIKDRAPQKQNSFGPVLYQKKMKMLND